MITLPETNSKLALKINGWKTIRLPFGARHLLEAWAASFREGINGFESSNPSDKLMCHHKKKSAKLP